jgi:hypothetical protein
MVRDEMAVSGGAGGHKLAIPSGPQHAGIAHSGRLLAEYE